METIRTCCGIALAMSFVPLFITSIASLMPKAKVHKKFFWAYFGVSYTLAMSRATLEFIYMNSAPAYTTYIGEVWPMFEVMVLTMVGICYWFITDIIKH